jgi:hypothetical protein
MSSINTETFPDVTDFRTDTKPELTLSREKLRYDFDAVLGKRNRVFDFVDYIFELESGFSGAVGSSMRLVTYEEAEEQMSRYMNYETSPLVHAYEDEAPEIGWDEWIKGVADNDGYRLVYDLSYADKYGDVVKQLAVEEDLVNSITDIEVVECTGGGRMFERTIDHYDEVYDSELLDVVQHAENKDVSSLC